MYVCKLELSIAFAEALEYTEIVQERKNEGLSFTEHYTEHYTRKWLDISEKIVFGFIEWE